jgi:hypothetical protein
MGRANSLRPRYRDAPREGARIGGDQKRPALAVVPKLVSTSKAPPESPTTIEATPTVPALLRKRPSKRPIGDDPQPEPPQVTVIGATFDGREASVDAEKPAPTMGMFEADAVNVGLPVPDTVALKLAVWLVKFAWRLPATVGVPVAPE